MGYLGSIWTIGIPIGGVYWLIKLKNNKNFENPVENSAGIISLIKKEK